MPCYPETFNGKFSVTHTHDVNAIALTIHTYVWYVITIHTYWYVIITYNTYIHTYIHDMHTWPYMQYINTTAMDWYHLLQLYFQISTIMWTLPKVLLPITKIMIVPYYVSSIPGMSNGSRSS